MNKKTKMWLGVGVVAAAAYYFWNKSKTAPAATTAATKSMASANGEIFANAGGTCNRNGEAGWTVRRNSNNVMVCASPDGMRSYRV